MTWRQLDCDVCDAKAPLHEILIGETLNYLCQICWEDILARAGDE